MSMTVPGQHPPLAAGTSAEPSRPPPDAAVPLQLVTERILLSALRAHDAELAAAMARDRAEFLAAAGVRFGASLDEEVTRSVVAGLALPGLRGWCVVDVVESDGGLRRLDVVHPDVEQRAAASALADRWSPSEDDPIGVPAVMNARRSTAIMKHVDSLVSATARDPDTMRILRSLGAGSLFVVPIIAHDVLLGAITFVSDARQPAFTPDDVALGEAVATRCAQAFEAARLYGAAKAARTEADIARREAEEARAGAQRANLIAETASEAKSVFLRNMSHELRTPLNAIGGYAQLMEMEIHGPVTAEQHVDLASIQRSQLHLLGMIDAVLHFAKIETGHVQYDLRSVECAEVLTWARSLVAPQARKRGIAVNVAECPSHYAVRADPQRLRQIVVNLLSNAVKFSNHDGAIEVSCAARGDSISIEVRDGGIGVPADQLEAIFAPFMQVRSDLTRPHEGTGLGLAISREMARAMGGELSVRSVLGAGSTFTLSLPAA